MLGWTVRLRGLLEYMSERVIIVIALSYILSHICFLIFSWVGFLIPILFSVLFLKNYFRVFMVVFFVVLFCMGRNYVDLSIENKIKSYVSSNYLDKQVDLEGYVYFEPVYKHEYARVVFKIQGEESFLVQGNVPRFPRLSVGQVCKISGTLVEPENFEEFDYKGYLRDLRIYYLVSYPLLDCKEEKRGFVLKNLLMELKNSARREVEKRLSEPQASLFLGVLFGERRVFEDGFQEALRVSSITHIIVASGYNVSIIYLGINKLFFFLPKRQRTLLSIVLIWLYCAVVGFTPSIIRATLMLSLTLFAVYYGVVSNIHIVFFSTIFLFIFIDPRIVGQFGFLLSAAATGGLIYVAPVIDALLARVLSFFIPFESLKNVLYRFLQNYFIPSLACTIVTVPIVAYGFQQVSIIGVVTNIMILPVLEYTLILGFFTLFFNYLFPDFSSFLFMTIWVQLKYFELVVNYLGNLGFVSFEFGVTISIVILFYVFLLLFVLKFYPLDSNNYYLNIRSDD